MVDLSHLHPDWQALAMRPVTERLVGACGSDTLFRRF